MYTGTYVYMLPTASWAVLSSHACHVVRMSCVGCELKMTNSLLLVYSFANMYCCDCIWELYAAWQVLVTPLTRRLSLISDWLSPVVMCLLPLLKKQVVFSGLCVCLSVCLFTCYIIEKVMNGFWWYFLEGECVVEGVSDSWSADPNDPEILSLGGGLCWAVLVVCVC